MRLFHRHVLFLGQGPDPEEVLMAIRVGDIKVAFKSGFEKYLQLSKGDSVVRGMSDAVGAMEQWEPVFQDNQLAMAVNMSNVLVRVPEEEAVTAAPKFRKHKSKRRHSTYVDTGKGGVVPDMDWSMPGDMRRRGREDQDDDDYDHDSYICLAEEADTAISQIDREIEKVSHVCHANGEKVLRRIVDCARTWSASRWNVSTS